jgi:protein-S-isoprenylcysteine O-methyltransferase Ste14
MLAEDAVARPGGLGPFHRWRRLVFAALAVIIFSSLLFVQTVEGPEDGWHEQVENLGIALILIAILGRTWCTLYIGGRKSAEIVRDGPYSATRNPLYFFSTLGAAGIGAMIGSVAVAIFLGLCCYVLFRFVIRLEEAHLEREFGATYRIYRDEVPRFFPDIRLFRDQERVSVQPHMLYRTFGDGLLLLASYPFFEIVEHLQEIGTLPVLLKVM